jgi:hypothetical protein
MGEWAYTFSQYKYCCFCVTFYTISTVKFLSIYNIYLVTDFTTIVNCTVDSPVQPFLPKE